MESGFIPSALKGLSEEFWFQFKANMASIWTPFFLFFFLSCWHKMILGLQKLMNFNFFGFGSCSYIRKFHNFWHLRMPIRWCISNITWDLQFIHICKISGQKIVPFSNTYFIKYFSLQLKMKNICHLAFFFNKHEGVHDWRRFRNANDRPKNLIFT